MNTVENIFLEINTRKSITKDDIPAAIFKHFAHFVAKPATTLINKCIKEGIWPDIFKYEVVTPIPKVFPPKRIEDVRNITGLLTLNKVAEKCVAQMIISDMKAKLDPSQYANQKGVGIQHYLIKMLNRILTVLDKSSKGEAKAVIATLIDWKQAVPKARNRGFYSCRGQTSHNPNVNQLLSEQKNVCKMEGSILRNQKT